MHPQDRLLIAEALVQFAGPSGDLAPRERRAWELAETIVAEEGLPMDGFVQQIDSDWSGPE